MGWLKKVFKKFKKVHEGLHKVGVNQALIGTVTGPLAFFTGKSPEKFKAFTNKDIKSDLKPLGMFGKIIIHQDKHSAIGGEVGAGIFLAYGAGKLASGADKKIGLPEGTTFKMIDGVKTLVDKDGNPVVVTETIENKDGTKEDLEGIVIDGDGTEKAELNLDFNLATVFIILALIWSVYLLVKK